MALTWAEARARAADVAAIAYAVDLDLATPGAERFGSRTTVRFTTTSKRTFLELEHAESLTVTVDGEAVEAAYDGERIALTDLPVDRPVEVVVDARLPYVTSGEGVHRFTDPADGETYVSAYCGMDIAHRVFACFDQNDLKARISLTVSADPRWTVLANGIGSRGRRRSLGLHADARRPGRPVRRLRRALGLGPVGAHGTPTAGSCPAAGTRGGRPPPTSSGTPTSCGRPPTRCSTTTPSCSTRRTRSTPATRSSCRVSTGERRRTRAA